MVIEADPGGDSRQRSSLTPIDGLIDAVVEAGFRKAMGQTEREVVSGRETEAKCPACTMAAARGVWSGVVSR